VFKRWATLTLAWLLAQGTALADGILVIAHAGVPKTDLATLQRIYTGKVIEINTLGVVPLNAPPGHPTRTRFLRDFLHQDEEKYTGYWTVRRYIGKGTPPQEVASPAEMIAAVQSTPGAIGYIHDSDWKPGLNVLFRQ